MRYGRLGALWLVLFLPVAYLAALEAPRRPPSALRFEVTVKEGLLGRHLTFVPLAGATIGPDVVRVAVLRSQVKDAPIIQPDGDPLSSADESSLYHHFQLNYTPTETTTGQRLVRR